MRYFKNIESETVTNQTKKIMSKVSDFQLNQIVRGKVAGVFVILGFRVIDGENYAQLKCVDPNDLTKTHPGELALPLTAIKYYN